MDRMAKKCLFASATTHAFLVLIVFVGSAFLAPKNNPPAIDPVRLIPSKLIDEALSGGGGNPNLARTDDIKKGNTLVPQPPAAEKEPPVKEPVKAVAPPPPPPKVEKAEPVKPKPTKTTKVPDKPKTKEPEKVVKKEPPPKNAKATEPKATSKDPKDEPLELKPTVRVNDARRKAEEKAQAEQKTRAEAQAREAREAARQWAESNTRLAKALGRVADHLEEGFASGTKVDVGGPGGVAYANYASFVQAIYDDAWETHQELSNNNFATVVKITIARDGTVIAARIVERSGNPAMDKSVQRALDKVKFVHPFPESARDSERTFTIEFNLKAKRLYG